MFGPVAVGLSSMAGIASAFAMVGVPGIIYGTGNAMTFWMLSGAAFAMAYIILGKKMRAMAEIAPISSLGDICDIRFNNNRIIKALMSIVICLGCVGYLAAQISAGSAQSDPRCVLCFCPLSADFLPKFALNHKKIC